MRGLRFTETMRGFCSTTVTGDDYEQAAAQGQRDTSSLDFTLTIATNDLDGLLNSPTHEAGITGQVVATALSPTPMAVTEGTWNLMVDDPTHVHAKRMKYLLKLNGATGPLIFEGFKQIHDDPGQFYRFQCSTS